MKKIGFIFFSLITFTVMAKELNVDMYGADPQMTQHILKKYGSQIMNLAEEFHQKILKNDTGLEKINKSKLHLIDAIKKEGNFLHVDLPTIIYSEKEIFTTIEVVKQEDKKRLVYLSSNTSSNALQPSISKNKDVMDEMIKYSEVGFELFKHDKLKIGKCPVYHCFVGFEHPQLKPYLKIFNEGVINNRTLILETLANDKNIKRRKAAVLLVGHFSNPKEIIRILLPYINDKNEGVRNDAMRVIATTMDSAKLYDIKLAPFITLLDSPVLTDRNKALVILANAIKLDKNKYQVAQCAKDKLLSLLALKQPNNHDFAYIILKEISKKDFGPTNVSAWKKWLYSNPYPVKCIS